MSIGLEWIAVRGVPVAELHALLEFAPTGESAQLGRERFVEAALPSGWHLIATQRADRHRFSQPHLATLSQRGELVFGAVEEHVMYSACSIWRQGHRVFRVEHAGDDSADDLTVEGEPPSCFEALRMQYTTQQAESTEEDADIMFELPLAFGEQLTGFRYDRENIAKGGLSFHTLKSTRRSWWRRILGR